MNLPEKTLRTALTDEERKVLDEMPDYTNIFTLMARSLRTGLRPFAILNIVLGTLVTAFCVFAFIQIFRVESTRVQLLWSLAAMGAFIWVGLAKVWFWLQLERQAVLLELKRAELRILSALEDREPSERG